MKSFEEFLATNADRELTFFIPSAIVLGTPLLQTEPKPNVLLLSNVKIYSEFRKAFLDHLFLKIDQISAWSSDTFAPEPVNFFLE